MSETTSTYNVPDGGTVSHRSTIESSGNPTAAFGSGGGTLSFCRIDSRECVRHQNSSSDYLIEWCYFEASGSGDDHADVIQAFAGVGDPGGDGTGTLTIRNTMLRLGGASTGCLFSADGFAGNYELDHVCCWAIAGITAGGRGIHIPIDGGGSVSMSHVYIVRDPEFPLFDIEINRPITLWEHVYRCDLDGDGMPINLTAIPEP